MTDHANAVDTAARLSKSTANSASSATGAVVSGTAERADSGAILTQVDAVGSSADHSADRVNTVNQGAARENTDGPSPARATPPTRSKP
jgi:hypothetical protein